LDWLEKWFPQQSTFWTRSLWDIAGPLEEDLHYVMDYALWISMFDTVNPKTVNKVLSAYRYQDEAKCIAHPHRVTEEVEVVLKDYLKHIPKARISQMREDLHRFNMTKPIGENLLSWVHKSYHNHRYEEAKQYLTSALQLYPPLLKDTTVFFLKLKLLLGPKAIRMIRKMKHPKL
jgi:hypothetical protein